MTETSSPEGGPRDGCWGPSLPGPSRQCPPPRFSPPFPQSPWTLLPAYANFISNKQRLATTLHALSTARSAGPLGSGAAISPHCHAFCLCKLHIHSASEQAAQPRHEPGATIWCWRRLGDPAVRTMVFFRDLLASSQAAIGSKTG